MRASANGMLSWRAETQGRASKQAARAQGRRLEGNGTIRTVGSTSRFFHQTGFLARYTGEVSRSARRCFVREPSRPFSPPAAYSWAMEAFRSLSRTGETGPGRGRWVYLTHHCEPGAEWWNRHARRAAVLIRGR